MIIPILCNKSWMTFVCEWSLFENKYYDNNIIPFPLNQDLIAHLESAMIMPVSSKMFYDFLNLALKQIPPPSLRFMWGKPIKRSRVNLSFYHFNSIPVLRCSSKSKRSTEILKTKSTPELKKIIIKIFHKAPKFFQEKFAPDVTSLTVTFFFLNFLAATQVGLRRRKFL